MSFAQHEMEVIRKAEANGTLAHVCADIASAAKAIGKTIDLLKATDLEAEDHIGDIVAALIIYCAKRDIDLTRCLRDAVERMK